MDTPSPIKSPEYLKIPTLSPHELSSLYQQEEHAIWKALLKAQQSKRQSNPSTAITELKLGKSFISSYTRNTISLQNQHLYLKTMVHILSNLINYYLQNRDFQEAQEVLDDLIGYVDSPGLVRQALGNLIGSQSVLQLVDYRISGNAEFKYASDVQIQFLFVLAKCKYAAGRFIQAREALEKIVVLVQTVKVQPFLLVRVYDILVKLQPKKYQAEYDKVCKACPPQYRITTQQRTAYQQIIKKLLKLQKSCIFSQSKLQLTKKSQISKQMMWRYLNKVLKNSSLKFQDNYIKSVLDTFFHENNPFVLREMLQSSSLAVEAEKVFSYYFYDIARKCILYNFRRLFNIPESKFRTTQKIQANMVISNLSSNTKGKSQSKLNESKSSKLNNRSISSELPKKSGKKLQKSITRDFNRANEILKRCEIGNFLSKANFGNSSITKKYVRIEEKGIAWAKDQESVEYDSTICKWKHVLGLTYGKVSNNFCKPKFAHLEPWKCFSLISEDRSFDFWCENESDIFFWLQGISYKLQLFYKDNEKYPYYSKGRALWKMTLLKMKSLCINQKRNYRCKNAGAVIEWGKLKKK